MIEMRWAAAAADKSTMQIRALSGGSLLAGVLSNITLSHGIYSLKRQTGGVHSTLITGILMRLTLRFIHLDTRATYIFIRAPQSTLLLFVFFALGCTDCGGSHGLCRVPQLRRYLI